MGRKRQRRKRRQPGRNRIVCPSGKVGYPNAAAADDALAKINAPDSRHNRWQPPPTERYTCPLCSAYHLTSDPRR